MCVIQFVQRDIDHQILLREGHVLIHLQKFNSYQFSEISELLLQAHLKGVIEVADFAKVVEKLVDTGFVILNKRV